MKNDEKIISIIDDKTNCFVPDYSKVKHAVKVEETTLKKSFHFKLLFGCFICTLLLGLSIYFITLGEKSDGTGDNDYSGGIIVDDGVGVDEMIYAISDRLYSVEEIEQTSMISEEDISKLLNDNYLIYFKVVNNSDVIRATSSSNSFEFESNLPESFFEYDNTDASISNRIIKIENGNIFINQ